MQVVVELAEKFTRGGQRRQIGGGRCRDARREGDRLIATEAAERPALNRLEEFGLHPLGQLGHVMQEQEAGSRFFQHPGPGLFGGAACFLAENNGSELFALGWRRS